MFILKSQFFFAAYIFSGAVVSLYNTIFTLCATSRGKERFYSAALFFVFSLTLIEHVLTHYKIVPFDFVLFPASTMVLLILKYSDFLIGPLFYCILSPFFNKKTDKLYLHFLPMILITIIIYSAVSFKINDLISNIIFSRIIFVIEILSLLYFFIYLLYILITIFSLYSFLKMKFKRGIIQLAAIILISIITILLSLYITGTENINESFVLYISTTAIFLFTGLFSYAPELFSSYKKEFKRGSYKRSLLKGIDASIVKQRLFDLMDDEKLYVDEDLTLKKLANIMELTIHQLSELLNVEIKQNFITFINKYRIEYAKQLLIDHPGRSIIDIGMSSGFNSKSTFNKIFKENTGKSPSEYRKNFNNFLI